MNHVVRTWRCLSLRQRRAILNLLGPFDETTCFAPTLEDFDDVFGASPNGIAESRALLANLGAFIYECSPEEGVFITVIGQNYFWIAGVRAALLSGCISFFDPKCQRLTFPSPPDPACTGEFL